MKQVYILLFFTMFSGFCFAQCVNADFSQGDFSNWTGSTGENINGIYSNIVPGIMMGAPNSTTNTGRQTIMNLPGTDPNTGNTLSVLPPGGISSCRLGNSDINSQAERLSYTYSVNSNNYIFTYQYAVVLEDPSHTPVEQPKFTIYVMNAAGNVVDTTWGIYEVSSSSGIPGFQNYVISTGDTVRWKNWSTVDLDLSSYIGQSITIEFTTYDCSLGAHFGYAYISCYCGTVGIPEFDSNDLIQISPNPSNGVFTLTFQQFQNKNLEIEIFNSFGQQINKDILNAKTKTIDISRFPKGIYFLKISLEEKYLLKKIIIK